MGHEAGLRADLTLDDDIATLHGDTDARPAITFDMDRAASHRSADRHAAITANGDMAARHTLAGAPPGVLADRHTGTVVEATAIIAHRAFEADVQAGRKTDAEIVPRQRVAHQDRGMALGFALYILIDLADSAHADINDHLAHAATLRFP